ncbi:glycosyltransferase family 2 protein [Propionibacteriaceae bacterium Y1923]
MPFAVIIPTLQRSTELPELLQLCAAHRLVDEVIVINNHPRPLETQHDKVQVLQQPANIYVNPAWNLGVRRSTSRNLAILNDDILFTPTLFDHMDKVLQRKNVGIVGPDRSAMNTPDRRHPRIHPVYRRSHGYGTAMFMRRTHYAPIPDEIKIYYGDEWLFRQQARRNYTFTGHGIRTEMSVTSGSQEFTERLLRDREAFRAVLETTTAPGKPLDHTLYVGARRTARRLLGRPSTYP